MICYYFYKNVMLCFCEIYFAVFNGFSSQIYYLDWLPLLYNAMWTSWTCLFAYMFDRDVNEEYSYKYPVLYKAGQVQHYFGYLVFWKWMLLSVWHGAVIYFIPFYGLNGATANGSTENLWFVSSVSFTVVVHTVIIKLLIESQHWNYFLLVSTVISFVLFYGMVLLGSWDVFSTIF